MPLRLDVSSLNNGFAYAYNPYLEFKVNLVLCSYLGLATQTLTVTCFLSELC